MISSDFGTTKTILREHFLVDSTTVNNISKASFPKEDQISFKNDIFLQRNGVFLPFLWATWKKTSYLSLSFLQLSQRGPLTAICCSQLKRMLECLTVELLRNICDCHNEGLFSTSCDNWYVPQQNSVHKNFRNTLSFCCTLAKQRLMINFSKINSTPFHRYHLLARYSF